jgi:hypothetical protein
MDFLRTPLCDFRRKQRGGVGVDSPTFVGSPENNVRVNSYKLRPAYGAPPGHIPALDGLRAIAILFVMFYHFTATYIRAFSGILYKCFDVGWCGVDLFFVLSGFLITGILLDAKNGPHSSKGFT